MENNRFYRVIRKIIRPITNFLWPVTIINKNKFDEGKGIYVCNHFSLLDPVPFVTELFDYDFNALMKEESIHIPVLGKILLKIGVIPIQREEADLRAIKKCMSVLKNDGPLIVFPEGTRNKSGSREMLDFKDGVSMFALKTKSPIIPMVYYRPIKTFRRTYLLIGDPIDLSEYYDGNLKDVRGAVTENLKAQMHNMQIELDNLLADKKALKKMLKAQKVEYKQKFKQKKLEYKNKLLLESPKTDNKEKSE